MSIATLTQVYDEVRRLAIAGSSVAPGDFRLKKLIPPLEQAGAKAPVFAKVAQAVQSLVDSTEKTASPALLELTTLVSAVLYTQGETGIEGTLEPIPTTDLGIRATQTSARAIKPLIEALTTTGSGRVEIVRDAIDRKLFHDLRLVRPAVRAIDDPYPEIADLIVQHVLPLYGKAIVPELKASFDLKSKSAGDQRRLKLMHQLDPAGTRELVKQALEGGSKEMKIVAIECLGASDADIGYLLEQSKAKAKDVRAAAYRALVRAPAKSVDSVRSLLKALEGDDIELVAGTIAKCGVPAVDDAVVEQAGKQLALVLKEKDAKKLGAAIQRMIHLAMCLNGRTDAKAEAALLACLDAAPKLAKLKAEPASGSDLNETVAQCLLRASPKAKERLAALADSVTGPTFIAAIQAAIQTMPPGMFFDRFSPLLDAFASKKRGPELSRAEQLEPRLLGRHGHRFYGIAYSFDDEPDARSPVELDPRWLDAAIRADRLELVCHLAKPGHAASHDYLKKKLKAVKEAYDGDEIVAALIRVRHPEATQLLIDMIRREAKDRTISYAAYRLSRLIELLPKSALPSLEAILPELPDSFVDRLIDGIAKLRTKPDGE